MTLSYHAQDFYVTIYLILKQFLTIVLWFSMVLSIDLWGLNDMSHMDHFVMTGSAFMVWSYARKIVKTLCLSGENSRNQRWESFFRAEASEGGEEKKWYPWSLTSLSVHIDFLPTTFPQGQWVFPLYHSILIMASPVAYPECLVFFSPRLPGSFAGLAFPKRRQHRAESVFPIPISYHLVPSHSYLPSLFYPSQIPLRRSHSHKPARQSRFSSTPRSETLHRVIRILCGQYLAHVKSRDWALKLRKRESDNLTFRRQWYRCECAGWPENVLEKYIREILWASLKIISFTACTSTSK